MICDRLFTNWNGKNILPSIQPVNSDGYQSYCKLWTNNFLSDDWGIS